MAPVPRLRQVVFDSTDPRRAAEFWRQLLDLNYLPGQEPPAPGDDDPAGRDWLNLVRPDGTRCLAFQHVDALPASTWPDTTVPQQLHLDLDVATVADLDAAHDHARLLGARLVLDRSNDADEPLRVYTDPDGHPFCIFVSR